MKINSNSFAAKHYLFWFKKLPNNLCPFFWKSIIVFIYEIAGIVGLGLILFDLDWRGLLICVGAGIVIYFLVQCVRWVWQKISWRFVRVRPVNQKPIILFEFIKASYYKYCPKIDWE